MSWYSILPPNLTSFEEWLIRFFVILGTLTIGPWAFFILYDILLYIWRASTYEIPIIGGRARGRQRPMAPSLSERPSGRRRAFSLRGTAAAPDDGSGVEDEDCDGMSEDGKGSGSRSDDEDGDVGGFESDGDVRRRQAYAGPDG